MTYTQSDIIKELEQIELMLAQIIQRSSRIANTATSFPASGTDTSYESILIADTGRASIQPNRFVRPPASPVSRRIKEELRYRNDLCELFGPDLVADPVWTMILELLLAASENKTISVTSLCIASGVAQTTALRWIGIMEAKEILKRKPDTIDRRRVYIELTGRAMSKVAKFLERHR